jgi:chromosomal replication initiation ATPase DnaA
VNPLLTTVATKVAGEFGSKLSSILSSTRGRPEDARARAIAMYVYQRADCVPQMPCLTALGRQFGRDRTTVRHALRRVEAWKKSEPGFRRRLERVQQDLAAEGYPGGVQ